MRNLMGLVLLFLIMAFGINGGWAQPASKPERINGRQALEIIRSQTSDNIADKVSPNLALKAVRLKCGERWARFAIGDPIWCANDEGMLTAYMFPVKPNADQIEPPEVLFENNFTSTRLSLRAGEYWTFVISADMKNIPIPTSFNTLPPLYTSFNHACKAIAESSGVTAVRLKRYYFLGHRGEFFEFIDAEGKSVLVDAGSLKKGTAKQVLKKSRTSNGAARVTMLDDQTQQQEAEYQRQAHEAWRKIMDGQ